ncbi:hypothetical protein [Actinoplanes awajinensis]|uniref:PE domain-containing protein n=1 Tax=Actinoplanes awajinensis subsp. mycoplanecinus TaxID=135947 RepID=A0A101JKN1_9ACTN|nr:hypothetical protein [Actinoplanes awajinensis]KUL28588.1 hypothetical protein ADL15_31520 [Actinoplanes awajinensis subsp. mycoplanecinus]
MIDQLQVDPALLESIADRLRRAGAALGGIGEPPPLDAGEAAAATAELLATIAASTANLAGGLQTAAGRVADAGLLYQAEDRAAALKISGAP